MLVNLDEFLLFIDFDVNESCLKVWNTWKKI